MAALAFVLAAPAFAASGTEVGGHARFQVLTPTLIRLEYAADRRFEDRRSLNVSNRVLRARRYTARRRDGSLEIRTTRLVLRYRLDSGPFTPDNLSVTVRRGRHRATARPQFGPAPGPAAGPPSFEVSPYTVAQDPGYRARTSGNIGGWYRALDLAGGPVPLHDGLLSRDGWYLLDDTHTALLQDAAPGFAVRPPRDGPYQDGYLFGYGDDYATALKDLRRLTGPAPLLPRKAFGVWFSRYFNYRQSDYQPLLARFRAEGIPLDVLMVDTDFKSPHAWNGWGWNPSLFPDPASFFRWAHDEGLAVSLNTHPSITSDDPALDATRERAGGELRPDPTGLRCRIFVGIGDVYGTGVPGLAPECFVFDWARAGDQSAYLSLHEPFEREGVDFWWLDYCCDESYASAAGLTADTWINHLYAARNRARASRWPLLSRVGASVFDPDAAGAIWGEHRNVIHFTGDARPTWEMLDFQTLFTTAEGNVGIPYVSHDIGGFGAVTSDGTTGRHLPDDLYVRWVQSGTFQPILRLHSDHGDRLPWDYPGKAQTVATEFLRLRGALVPYLYTLAREAHERGLPITRGTYLRWPGHDEAYAHDRQYMLGPQLLVAPVGTPGDPARKDVWFPPGEWIDLFAGERHRGPAVKSLSVPLERMPVFARAGAVIPLQQPTSRGTPDPLLIDFYPGRSGAFILYEDAGDGLEYLRRRHTHTRLTQSRSRGTIRVKLGPARGDYSGRPRRRSFELRLLGVRGSRRVFMNGRRVPAVVPGAPRGWWRDSRGGIVVRTGPLPTARAVSVVARTR